MQINSTRQQTISTTLSTGDELEIDFIYNACVMRWFYNVRLNELSKNGYMLVRGANMLEGISITATLYCVGNFDFPYLINDFEEGNFDIVEGV